MADAPDWTDRFDEEIAAAMVRGWDSPEGGETGIPEYLGIRFTEVTPGRAVAELEVTEALLNPFGAAHGAVLASLVDHVLGSTVFPVVPRGTWPATLEFKLNYQAPTRPGILRGDRPRRVAVQAHGGDLGRVRERRSAGRHRPRHPRPHAPEACDLNPGDDQLASRSTSSPWSAARPRSRVASRPPWWRARATR